VPGAAEGMCVAKSLRVVFVKPSKYAADGYVERFRRGFMPNSTLPHIRSMTPERLGGLKLELHTVDEYVHAAPDYFELLRKADETATLLALVGVQSNQFHRALDLAAYARKHGCMAVIGGPHPMTCDTSDLHGRGVSFALAEAELVWPTILRDAAAGELRPVYGLDQRWQRELDAPVIIPPSKRDLRRYVFPLLGLYPARGCPFSCNYCSVIKIAGRQLRSQSIETTVASLRAAERGGVRVVMFTSDNFNKYPQAVELLNAIVEEGIRLKFFVQCDTQISKQEQLIALLARAGCFQMFLGIESFDRTTLLSVRKGHNHPELYQEIIRLCRKYGISSHFSNMIGFPQDCASDIRRQVDILCSLGPTWASFYVMCPIPGTEQYDDFLRQGLLSERNLDRFDTTCLTWRHPNMTTAEMASALSYCYRTFYSARHAATIMRHPNSEGAITLSGVLGSISNTAFNRYAAWQKRHPMSGGVWRVRSDTVADLLHLRREVFGVDLAPLPPLLRLPEADQAFNRGAGRAASHGAL
jgi:hypothetical protein